MAVDSYIELFTTLFGWVFYNTIWDVLTDTGLVFLPFLSILLDNFVNSYTREEDVAAGATSLRGLEIEFFMAFFVVMLAGNPIVPLDATEVSYTPQALLTGVSPSVATPAKSHATFGAVSFQSSPKSVDVPLWWYGVLKFMGGFNRAITEAVPPAVNIREYTLQLDTLAIEDPKLMRETDEFYRDCFVEARSKWIAERPDSAAINQLLNTHGKTDTEWLGSHVFLDTPGYYDTLRADSIHSDFPYNANRDVEWAATDPARPLNGKPACKQWWMQQNTGLKAKLVAEAGVLDTLSAIVESGFDQTQRQDAMIRALLNNGPPRWLPRGYDYAYYTGLDEDGGRDLIQNVKEAAAAVGLLKESIFFSIWLNILLKATHMVQALTLMGIVTLLPLFVVFSRYRLSILAIGALLIFTVKYWTVLWFFAYWVDANLIRAMYPDPGAITKFFNSQHGDLRLLLNMLTGALYIGLPMVFSMVIGVAGFQFGQQLNNASSSLTNRFANAGRFQNPVRWRKK